MRKNMQSKASNCRSSATRSLKANAALGLSKAAVVALAAMLAQGSVSGASTYWDGDGLGSVGGGAGYWNATLGRWSATAGGSSYLSFASGDTAVFAGTGGVVYTTAAVTGNLDFQSNGFTLVSQNNTNQIVFPNPSATINVASGVSAQLNSMGTLSGSLTKTGGGTFFLNYTISSPSVEAGAPATNSVDIQDGTLAIARHALFRAGYGAGSINTAHVFGTSNVSNTAVNIGATGALNVGKFNITVGGLSGSGKVVLGALNDQKGVAFAPNFIYGATLRLTKSSNYSGNIVDDGTVDAVNAPFSGGHLVIGTNVAATSIPALVDYTLGGNNTFRGATWVTQGVNFYLQNGNALPDNSPLIVNLTPISGTNVASLVEFRADEKFGSLTSIGSGAAFVNPNGHTITIGGDNLDTDFVTGVSSTTTGGDIGGGIAYGTDLGGKIVKAGTGTQFISPTGSITFSGNYEIKDGGRLSFNSDGASGVASSFKANFFDLNGGTLGSHGNATLSANKGITVESAGGGIYAALLSSGQFLGIQGKVTGTGTLTKTGSGSVTFSGDNSTFSGTLAVADGFASVGKGGGALTALGDRPAGTGSIDISQGYLEVTSDLVGAGSDQSANLASASGSKLSFGPGAILLLNKNGNNSLMVNVGTNSTSGILDRKSGGSMLVVAGAGASALGTATGEKLIINGNVGSIAVNTGTLPDTTPDAGGTVIPGVIITSSTSVAGGALSTEGYFATHDATNGLKTATMSNKSDINNADGSELFLASASQLVAADKSVYGLKIGTTGVGADVNLGGKKLSIGAGASTDPATLILGNLSNVKDTIGGGTLDFGGHEAVIYTSAGAGSISVPITGTNGLTKMGYGPLNFGTQTLAYSGKTTIEQGIVNISVDNQLPTSTDLVFAGTARDTSSRPTLALNGKTLTVRSINSANRGGAFSTTLFEAGPAIDLGVNGVLQIVGAGTSNYAGHIRNGTGATSSSIVVDGGGYLQLGLAKANAKDGSPDLAYNKLLVKGGSTVAIDIAANNHIIQGTTNGIATANFAVMGSLPNNATATADAIKLDGGTLKFTGTFGNTGNGVGGSDANGQVPFVANLLASTGRGFQLGAGGGTINIENPYAILNMAGVSVGSLTGSLGTGGAISGTGLLTKKGAGTLQMPLTTAPPSGTNAALVDTSAAKWTLNIEEGMVAIEDDGSLGPTPTTLEPANITINGGVLGSNVNTYLGTTTLGPNRGITIGPAGGTIVQNRAALVINGPLAGIGSLRIAQLAVANATTFNAVSNTFSGPVTLASGYLIWANNNNALGTGPISNDPAYQVQFGTSVGSFITLSNPINIVKGNGTSTDGRFDILVNSATGTLSLTGKISGNGDLNKGYNVVRGQTSATVLQSAGALELANSANDFAGDINIFNGLLIPTADGALSTTASKVVMTGGNLGFKGNLNYTQAKPVSIGNGGIRNISDTNSFAGPITMMSSGTLTGTAGQLTLTGAIGGPADAVLRKAGVGTVVLAGANTYTGGTTVVSGPLVANKLSNGTLTITSGAVGSLSLAKLSAKSAVNDPSGTTKVPALSIGAGTAALDLTNNAFVEDYSGASTYATVLGEVKNGYNTGNWDGASGTAGVITSSSAAAQALTTVKTALIVTEATDQFSSFPASFFGETVDNTSTLIQYGLAGDATLDGKVNTLDFNMLAGNFNAVGTAKWVTGDFNYDTNVDSTDFNILAGNYANVMPVAAPSLGAVVPEPGSIMMIALAATGLLARRSRRNGFQL